MKRVRKNQFGQPPPYGLIILNEGSWLEQFGTSSEQGAVCVGGYQEVWRLNLELLPLQPSKKSE